MRALLFRIGLALGSFALFFFLAISCVSKTDMGQRFQESEGLSAPTLASTPSDPNNFSFAVVGDLHLGSGDAGHLTTILNGAKNEGDSFVSFLGDIVNQGDQASVTLFRQTLSSMNWGQNVLPVIGNHDIFGDGWTAYKNANGPSHYVVNYGNSEFIAIDTADGAVAEPEHEWFDRQLASSTATHIFILSHYMPTTPGIRTYLRFADESEASAMMKLASSHHVTAWLGGHYHSFLQGQVDGVTYIVAGGGGAARMPPILQNFYVQVSVSGKNVTYTMHPFN